RAAAVGRVTAVGGAGVARARIDAPVKSRRHVLIKEASERAARVDGRRRRAGVLVVLAGADLFRDVETARAVFAVPVGIVVGEAAFRRAARHAYARAQLAAPALVARRRQRVAGLAAVVRPNVGPAIT